MREKRLVQRDTADRHTAGDAEMGKTEFLGERETSELSIIPERGVCLFHEDDYDQSAYSCPSPLIGRGSDDLEDLMVLPCQAWFGTRKHQKPLSMTLARSEVQIESPRERERSQPKFLNKSVSTRKVEGVRREEHDEANRCCWTSRQTKVG